MTEAPPSLEERVAALEDRLAYPMMLATAPEIGDEEAAKLEADLREAMGPPLSASTVCGFFPRLPSSRRRRPRRCFASA